MSKENPRNEGRTSAKLPKADVKKQREPRKIDWRIVVAGVLLIGALIVAIALNLNSTLEDTSKLTQAIEVDNGDLDINWDRYPTYEMALEGSLEIINPGTYHLTGELIDGMISVKANDGVVRLILDNVTIKNSNGPAILCDSAEDLVIELVGENYIEDGAEHASEIDEDARGTIYSKDDLTFQGDGKLTVSANFEDGIVGKDDLKFNGGTYAITAVDDGIRGTDSVYIVDGDFTINATNDAVKSTNETDGKKGFVLIENGNLAVKAGAKGIKAINTILIYDGEISIDAYDDTIHSNNYIGIVNGALNLTSGDDGIHADRELIIDGGTITVAKSYEGLEAQAVTINGGKINVASSDDGINAGSGADNSSANRPGANAFNTDENCIITINGGEIYINASGDGIDSNGSIRFNGGAVLVDGPTNNGNGALDSGTDIEIQGGTVIAAGSSGMAKDLGANSGIFNLSIYFDTAQTGGTKVTIKNASGEAVLEHTPAKTFSHIAAGSEKLSLGETYTIYLNDTEYKSFVISEATTTIGNSNVNQYHMPGNDRPESKRRR